MDNYRKICRQLSGIYSSREAQAIARGVMEDVFGLNMIEILLDKDNELSQADLKKLENIVARLLKNEPLQYITGFTLFCGHKIQVAPGVLIPRPETEELVELILHDNAETATGKTLLDIGTGSGCIAISVAKARPQWHVCACDISPKALEIASANAKALDTKINFYLENILHPESQNQSVDIIVSNPPYICKRETAEMARNVLDYEPEEALFVNDDDPLLFYRAIAEFGTKHLNENGKIYFEINRGYAQETIHLLTKYGYAGAQLYKDRFGNNRMVAAEWKNSRL